MHDKTDITSRQYIAETHLTFRDPPRVTEEALEEVAVLLREQLNFEGR